MCSTHRRCLTASTVDCSSMSVNVDRWLGPAAPVVVAAEVTWSWVVARERREPSERTSTVLDRAAKVMSLVIDERFVIVEENCPDCC